MKTTEESNESLIDIAYTASYIADLDVTRAEKALEVAKKDYTQCLASRLDTTREVYLDAQASYVDKLARADAACLAYIVAKHS